MMKTHTYLNSFKVILSYKGTCYRGWQIQAEGKGPTIQGVLNNILYKTFPNIPFQTLGASRTDAKVHAYMQMLRIDIDQSLSEKSLMQILNDHLPKDIYIISVNVCSLKFHPIRDALSKEYHYLFYSGMKYLPQFCDLISYHPKHLDIPLMQQACQLFCGTHDFINYFCTGSVFKTSIKTITHCELLSFKKDLFFTQNYFKFVIKGSGFLKQMVRLIVGALWALGKGQISLHEISLSLQRKYHKRIAICAPPEGLYLKEIICIDL